MRTPAAARRTGAGRALLEHLLAEARARGCDMLYLETGRHPAFHPAHALYRSVGLVERGAFGSYVDTGNAVYMDLRLG